MRRAAFAVTAAFLAAAALVVVAIALGGSSRSANQQAQALATNPNLDPGTALSGPAPGFTLADQFGRIVSLRSLRGRVALIAFIDPRCTTTCPLTTTTMVAATRLLGAAGRRVSLLGIDANPQATTNRSVRAYSRAHDLLHRWQFLTGSASALRRVWHAYHVDVQIDAGAVEQTPALFVIDPEGRWRKLYLTQLAYSSIGQQAHILASEISSLLPGHPAAPGSASFDRIPVVGPGARTALPRAGGGSIRVGPGAPRLLLFFASWLTENSNLDSELDALRQYQALAASDGLPDLVAVDEGSVEPSAVALRGLLHGLAEKLTYGVGVDRSGRVADGYSVQDLPWFVLTSRSGRILWYWDAGTQGWPTAAALARHVRSALSAPATVKPPSASEARRLLAGSPPALAAVHAQAGALLGQEPALAARLRTLRGYPVVVNAWASWCTPCKEEYPLFAAAAVRYGREVAFLGVDTGDTSVADGRAFLAAHPLSYPSYQSTITGLTPLTALVGLPTTIFIDRAGKIACVRPGQYEAEGALDGDIVTCALGG